MSGQRDPDWALVALNVSRIVFYAIDCATGSAIRSSNSPEIIGIPSAGPVREWLDVICPEDLARFEKAIEGLSPDAPSYEVEYRIFPDASKK